VKRRRTDAFYRTVQSNQPLHLTAPGHARACPSRRGAIVDARVPQVSGNALGRYAVSRRMNGQSFLNDPFGLAVLLVVVVITAVLVWGIGWLLVAYRGARAPLLLVVLGVGGVAGYDVLRTSSGYLAGLVWQQAVFTMLLVAIVSVVVAVVPRTRRYGVIGVVGAAAMLAAFFAVYLGGYYLGLHAWANDHPVPLR